MGRLFTAASSDRLSNTATPIITVKPLSLSCWYKPVNFAQQAMLVVLQSNTTANRQIAIAVQTGATAIAIERGATTSGISTSAGTLTAATWAHVGGTFATGSTGQRIAYLNGVAATAATTNVGTVPVPERTDIGAYYPTSIGTFGSFANGTIAMAAAWNVVLTAGEMNALARGVCPLLIRPASLKFYAPLLGTAATEPDYTAGQKALTPSGTAVSAGPPASPFPHFGGAFVNRATAAAGSGNAGNLLLLGAG